MKYLECLAMVCVCLMQISAAPTDSTSKPDVDGRGIIKDATNLVAIKFGIDFGVAKALLNGVDDVLSVALEGLDPTMKLPSVSPAAIGSGIMGNPGLGAIGKLPKVGPIVTPGVGAVGKLPKVGALGYPGIGTIGISGANIIGNPEVGVITIPGAVKKPPTLKPKPKGK